MKKNKILIMIIVSAIFVGSLLGLVPLQVLPAKTTQNNNWKSIKLNFAYRDSITIEERMQDIEKMMSRDLPSLIVNNKTPNKKSKNLYKYDEIKISKRGRQFIKDHESLSLTAYKLKGERRYTIGYGHVIYPGDDIPHKISKRRANEIFDEDMNKFESSIKIMLSELDHRFLYTQGFVDGLASLTYNSGPDGVRKTRFWQRMRASRYDKTIKNINIKDLEYAIAGVKTANISRIYKKGHTIRRSHEYKMMASK